MIRNMRAKIQKQIENINKSLEWIKKNKPQDYNQKFLQLAEERRKLKTLLMAQQENPAIAAYGISQVGKSYLMNCMLQKGSSPFELEGDGKRYKFIEEMNPITKDSEATGVVTRFTSFSRNPEKYCAEYPILMRCLSVSDIVLILSDGYYNDISDYTTYSEEEIKQFAEEKYNQFKSLPQVNNSPITADHILEIKAYYTKHINNAQAFLHTSFFDMIALIADKIPSSEWTGIFSILWHESEYQTRLFVKMVATLEKFNFAQYVYLPTQALLHGGKNENSVMSVQCLNGLFKADTEYFTDVYLRNNNSYEKVSHLTKSEVCAVCAEVIVKISEDYLVNTNSYNLVNIKDSSVIDMLTKGRETKENEKGDRIVNVNIDILRDNDLLDFPGARSRKKELSSTLSEDSILINVLLRGKVAYLFNIYNESKLINILLYCHHAAQNEVSDMPLLLRDWVMNYIGKTIEKRRKTLQLTGGISPLFYIGTKFNIDMQEEVESIKNGINALNGRWKQRFETVLYPQCFNVDGSLDYNDEKIFLNWTSAGECFSNSYILRDYKYSGPKYSKLYDKERTADRVMTISESYYSDMRTTFCNNKFVQNFFANPALSWDVAASMDNDGALYILEQLGKVASCMDKTRTEQFRADLSISAQKVLHAIEGYFVSSDVNELLEGNIRKAKSIFREMDFTCNNDNYYFGHLIQALQVTEPESYRAVHKIMLSPEINSKVNDFKDYEIIRSSCENSGLAIENAKNDTEKWQCVMGTYGLATQEEAEEYLTRKHIDVQKLFSGSFKRKQNSCVIADYVYHYWCSKIKSIDFLNQFANEGDFDSSVMTILVEQIVSTAESIHVADIMAGLIADYVNGIDIHTANESLIADMLANIIQNFVIDFGFSLLSEDDKTKAMNVCQSHNIPAFNFIRKELPGTIDESDLTSLFNEMSDNPKSLLPSFEDNYHKWIEYMFISFIANLEIPDYDYEANVALGRLLDSIKTT